MLEVLPNWNLLLTCSVLLWHIDRLFNVNKSIIIDHPVCEPSCIAFDHSGTLLAVAFNRDVEIRVLQTSQVYVTLEGHIARVTKCEFHPIRQHLFFTCSEDRTFKVSTNLYGAKSQHLMRTKQIWDLQAKSLLFQSAVLSAFPIFSLALNPVNGDACFGFGDGTIRIFALHETHAREQAILNVESHIRKQTRKIERQEKINDIMRDSPNVVSSLPPWARSERASETAQIQALVSSGSNVRLSYNIASDRLLTDDNSGEVACPILGMQYLCVDLIHSERDSATLSFNTHKSRELLDREQYLLVAVPNYVVSINAFSYEMRTLQDLQVPISTQDASLDAVAVAKEVSFHGADGSDMIFVGIASAFSPCFTMMCASVNHDRPETSPMSRVNIETFASNQAGENPHSLSSSSFERVSVIASGPPPKESVLNLPSLSTSKAKSKKKGGQSLDQPITFRTRIKSSGYGTSNPFGIPNYSQRPSIAERKTGKAIVSRPKASVESFLKEYPVECGLLQHHQTKHDLPPKILHDGAIHHIEYSADAKWLASAGNDKIALVSKLPFSRFQGDGNVFAGHEHTVRSIHWSQNNHMVVTTSNDKTSRVWLADSDVPSLTLNASVPPATNTFSSAKKAIQQEMVDAMFFYMDKFILSASGNSIRLHQFEIDELFARQQTKKTKKNDLLNEPNKSRKKKVAQYTFQEMQSITSLTCINGSFLSSIILLGGSDRSLRIIDAGVGKTTRVIHEAHTRPVHSVVLPQASCFVSHPANFYDLLLSSSTSNIIHLWDIRADNCIMRFGEHVNRVHQLGAAFSPCMRYVATGSEDRLTYLYDIRTGRCLKKLSGHSDVVTSVAFNPLYPQLATASYDGSVHFYSDSIE